MGESMVKIKSKLGRLKNDDPIVRAFDRIVSLMSPEHSASPYMIPGSDPVEWVLPPGTTKMHSFELAEELVRMDRIKSFASSLESAASEYVTEIKQALHASMLANGPARIDDYGYTFSMTATTYAQADKEQGGTNNPTLKQWLRDNSMPDVAEGSINAATLKSAVTRWMEDNAIVASVAEGDEMRELGGEELLAALKLVDYPDPETGEIVTREQQYAARVAKHEQLHSMMNISSKPNISMTAAK